MKKADREILLERINFATSKTFSKHDLECLNRIKASFGQTIGDEIVCHFRSFIHGLADHKIEINRKFPRTWWQYFKDRWFPNWLKLKFPVDYEHIYIDQTIYKAVCPHIQDNGKSRSQKVHWNWMINHN